MISINCANEAAGAKKTRLENQPVSQQQETKWTQTRERRQSDKLPRILDDDDDDDVEISSRVHMI